MFTEPCILPSEEAEAWYWYLRVLTSCARFSLGSDMQHYQSNPMDLFCSKGTFLSYLHREKSSSTPHHMIPQSNILGSETTSWWMQKQKRLSASLRNILISLHDWDSNTHENTVNIWTSSFEEGWGAKNLPLSQSSSNLGTTKWGLQPFRLKMSSTEDPNVFDQLGFIMPHNTPVR